MLGDVVGGESCDVLLGVDVLIRDGSGGDEPIWSIGAMIIDPFSFRQFPAHHRASVTSPDATAASTDLIRPKVSRLKPVPTLQNVR